MRPGTGEADMGTTHQSSFEYAFALFPPERTVLDSSWKAPNRLNRNQRRVREPAALQDVFRWQPAKPQKSHNCLDACWKIAVERITGAAEDAQERSSRWARPAGAAKIVLDNLPIMKQALAESHAGIQGAHRLPHVGSQEWPSPVPRSFTLAAVYLRFAEFRFDEQGFARFLSAVQKDTPLEMSEIWNLKSFLELVLLEQIGGETAQIAICDVAAEVPQGPAEDRNPSRLSALLNSLLSISSLDWKAFFEKACLTEQILRMDPSCAYEKMDFETREAYRAAVVDLAAHSNSTESEVARKAIALSRPTQQIPHSSESAGKRRTHVGYYLVDAGQAALKKEIEYRPPLIKRFRDSVFKWSDFFYFLGIELITFGLIALLISLLHVKPSSLFALALFVLPALECAVTTVNMLATRLFSPRKIPKLDFSAGIPQSCATVVAVPALLTNEEQVLQAVLGLEVRFLANRDPNLHFALLTDLPDATQQFNERESLVGLCSRLLRELDEKYAHENKGRLFHFHRNRTYNPAEELWMGWERKRGKLLDFNRFLLQQDDRFPVKTGDTSFLKDIRYVITLDLDTQLPPGAGHRLVGTLAHPLNCAVIDPAKNTVVEGYGILQPRVEISIKSAIRSRFASLLSGDTGFDIYAQAVSDVYQDLFGEAIFTGKGIYEVETFQKVLEYRFPCNALLSHDLIEGVYARTGLVSDIEVVDDYPSHFSAFSRRKHRWVRGDWQIMFSLFPRVRNYFGQVVSNPLSHISRWKIFDNLRRSLTEFATLLLFLYGWLLLPGDALHWTLAAVAVMLFPVCLQFLLAGFTGGKAWFRADFWRNLCADCSSALARVCVRLAFLCHQSLIDLDAIVRTVVRMKFTHRRLLEWETAADAELTNGGNNFVDACLQYSLLLTVALGPIIFILHPGSLKVAMPFLVLWAASVWIGEWLNRPQHPLATRIKTKDRGAVRSAALRTWRFFHEFSNPEENWLIPDIVQEAPPLIAHRISPTNLGLLLNSRLAAHDLGFLTTQEFVRDTERTLETVNRMPKCKGHLYNWYATDSLEPVPPFFVSTVDNGNLLCSLWTLKQGCLEMIKQPLLRPALWESLRDHADLLAEVVTEDSTGDDLIAGVLDLKQAAEQLASADLTQIEGLRAVEIDALVVLHHMSKCNRSREVAWWGRESSVRVTSLLRMMETFAPWLDARFEGFCPLSKSEIRSCARDVTLESIPRAYGELCKKLDACSETLEGKACATVRHFRAALEKAVHLSEDLVRRLTAIAAAAQSMADEMNFDFLYDAKKELFSIGYDEGEGALSKYNYDLFASEARAAVFVAVAKGEAPRESWFHLKRSFRPYKREHVLLSWSGTAFEYLMPCLWMRAYPNTLLERSVRGAIRAQQKFARGKGIPWGISESSCAERNPDGHYRYHAFGVPGLALHRDACSDDLVVAPYATFLGMMFDTEGAVKNLRKMKSLGWLSAYGFYEAADFTLRRNSDERGHVVVRNWMAHHQGMSLVAAANVLCGSAMQRRFHAEPRVVAIERLLHERRPRVLPYEEDAEAFAESSPPLAGLAVQIPRPGFRELIPKPL
jgi:cyclic beta-1,2-glucan synthetase